MKRRIALLAAACVAVMALGGCQKINEAPTAPAVTQGEADGAKEEPAGKKAEEGKGVNKVAYITSQRLGDDGPVDIVYRGIKAGCDEAGIEVHVVEAKKGEYEESMQAMISEGYNLIFAVFPELLDSVKAVAKQNPDVSFIHAICATKGDNLEGICCYEQQSSFVMGVLAAMTTKNNKVAFVGGVDNPDTHRYLDGYLEGIEYVNPDIEVQTSWIGSFEDPAKAKELALVHYQNGVDVLWGSGGKSALGLYEAAKEMGEGYYVMGCTDDNNDRLPGQVLASHYEAWDTAAKDLVIDWNDGVFEPGLKVLTLENGYAYCKLADESQCEIPQEVRDKVEEVTEQIKSGEIVVKSMPSYEEVIATLE